MRAKQSATASEARPALRCADPAPVLEPEFTEDDTAWPERCERWLAETHKPHRRRAVRGRPKQPLVLCGHGVLLRVENGALTIRNGFTHYPQKQETYRFFKGELTIPPRIIMLDGSGSISFDVLAWPASKMCLSFASIGKAMCRASWPTADIQRTRTVFNGSSKLARIQKVEWRSASI